MVSVGNKDTVHGYGGLGARGAKDRAVACRGSP